MLPGILLSLTSSEIALYKIYLEIAENIFLIVLFIYPASKDAKGIGRVRIGKCSSSRGRKKTKRKEKVPLAFWPNYS